MSRDVYRYLIQPRIPMDEVESTLVLAILATESLHGESQVQLEAPHAFDASRRACVIDARTDVGRDLNKLFLGFMRREYGPDGFTVERVFHSERTNA